MSNIISLDFTNLTEIIHSVYTIESDLIINA